MQLIRLMSSLACLLLNGTILLGGDLEPILELLREGQRFKDYSITVEVTRTYQDGRKEVFRDEMWFIEPDVADAGKMQFAQRRLVKNPGEPHIDDEWIDVSRASFDGKVVTTFTRNFISQPTMAMRYSNTYTMPFSRGSTALNSAIFEGVFVGRGDLGRSAFFGNYFALHGTHILYKLTGKKTVLGLECDVLSSSIKTGNEGGDYFISQEPRIAMKITRADRNARPYLEIQELRTVDGMVVPWRGIEYRYDDLPPDERAIQPDSSSFEVISMVKKSASVSDWHNTMVTGSQLTDVSRRQTTTIPYTLDEMNAIRKALSMPSIESPPWNWPRIRFWLNISLVVIIALLIFRKIRTSE